MDVIDIHALVVTNAEMMTQRFGLLIDQQDAEGVVADQLPNRARYFPSSAFKSRIEENSREMFTSVFMARFWRSTRR